MSKDARAVLRVFRELVTTIGDPRVDDFLAGLDWEMPPRQLAASALACTRWLLPARLAASLRTEPLVSCAAAASDRLAWKQTYTADDFGSSFLDNYGWVELFGTRGHFVNASIAGGLLVLGPGTHYPLHSHIAEEIYVPLTSDTDWSKGNACFAKRCAGEVVHHPSGVAHAMKTETAPLVAAYLWRGGPLAQKSVLHG
jgi:hypothetical protein